MRARKPLCVLGVVTGLTLASCLPPDCRRICERALRCDVTFTPSDDPNLRKIEAGQRTPQSSCELGCQESLTVDAQSEACMLAVDTTDPRGCRGPFMACVGQPPDAPSAP